MEEEAYQLKLLYDIDFEDEDEYEPSSYLNGFDHPYCPVITNESPNNIQLFQWGLIPSWAKDKKIQNSTLNAKVETLEEKPSFRDSISKRCLVLVDGFYEWKWLDGKGKSKEKHLITVSDSKVFAFAGLWNTCKDPITGLSINSYTIITTEANELMSEIHNSAKRMPMVLAKGYEKDWLMGGEAKLTENLQAISLEPPLQQSLF